MIMLDNKKELPQNTATNNTASDEVADMEAGKIPARKDDVSLRDLFNRFLEEDFFLEPFDFTRSQRLASLFNRQFVPRVDVSETDSQVKVTADVPGVKPEDLDIEIEGNRMSIRGKTQRESLPDERPYRYERTYGEFRREFTLPSEVNKEEVKAVYKDGVLTVTLPKTESSRKSRIQIERQ
jgi:HSP20 family protein